MLPRLLTACAAASLLFVAPPGAGNAVYAQSPGASAWGYVYLTSPGEFELVPDEGPKIRVKVPPSGISIDGSPADFSALKHGMYGRVTGAWAGSDLSTIDAEAVEMSAGISESIGTNPVPPLRTVDTSMPVQEGRTLKVLESDCNDPVEGLQARIDEAEPGDTVVIAAGQVCQGHYWLRHKPAAAGWIVIRSEAADLLPPPGSRVSPDDAVHMPKILTAGPGPGNPGGAAIQAEPQARNYRLIGLEVTTAYTTALPLGAYVTELILLGTWRTETKVDQMPYNIVIDRSYLHGYPEANTRRAIMFSNRSSAVIDSYISAIHDPYSDSQAICLIAGPGPFKIVNNYLEGAGENIMAGGHFAPFPLGIPADIEIRGNYLFKPLRWKVGHPEHDGRRRVVKNLFEIKNAQRVLFEGNVLENSWIADQSGSGILFNPVDGPGSTIEHVTLRNNILRNTVSGFRTAADSNGMLQLRPTNNLLLQNNLFDDISSDAVAIFNSPLRDATGKFYGRGVVNAVFDHNTFLQGRFILLLGDNVPPQADGIRFTNNIARGIRTFAGSGKGDGDTALAHYTSNYLVTKNVMMGVNAAYGAAIERQYAQSPGNYFPQSEAAVKFVNFADRDYRLAPDSPYLAAGTDGKDLGADMDAIMAATAKAVNGR